MSDALTAKLRALSDPRACQDNEFGASAACAEALAEIEALRGEVELHETHWTEARDERNKIRAWLCDKGLDAEYGETCDVPGCPKAWEEENAALRAERDRAIRLACKMTQACIDSTRFNRGASFSLNDSDEAVKLAALLSAPSASPVRLDDTAAGETR